MSKQVVLLAIDNISERKNLANNAKLSSLLKFLLIRCYRVAFGDEAKFSVSVFLRNHSFNFDISYIFSYFTRFL